MKISANYTVFYGADFMEYSLRSIYKHVDKIFITLGDKSWPNSNGDRMQEHIDDIANVIGKFIAKEDPEKKITLYTATWQSDTDQRNFSLEKARDAGMNYVMLIDSDEIWEEKQLKALLTFIRQEPDYDVYSVGIMHYWRSLFYRFEDQGTRVDYVYNLKRNIHHHWVRYAGDDMSQVQVPNAFYHHFGYAYPSYIVGQKVQYWEHHAEVKTDWFKEIFKKWIPPIEDGRRRSPQEALSPQGQDWSKLSRCTPPEIMKDHRYAKEILIP